MDENLISFDQQCDVKALLHSQMGKFPRHQLRGIPLAENPERKEAEKEAMRQLGLADNFRWAGRRQQQHALWERFLADNAERHRRNGHYASPPPPEAALSLPSWEVRKAIVERVAPNFFARYWAQYRE
ncbi:unnamed protein product [Oikopleura dioica]|uniref:Uncharacterized protein n=1 Tax=Oikopleura dioica TaxID=34765 RepID=E4WVG2_OIKDI|nr:unnamed protein product [Oikopleura dioica]